MENEITLTGIDKELFTDALLQSKFRLDEKGFQELRTAQDDDIFINWNQENGYRVRYAANGDLKITLFMLDEDWNPVPIKYTDLPLYI